VKAADAALTAIRDRVASQRAFYAPSKYPDLDVGAMTIATVATVGSLEALVAEVDVLRARVADLPPTTEGT
jgi:hypothetical protein